MSSASGARAISAVQNGHVTEVKARVLRVQSGDNTYTVVVTADRVTCDCVAGQHGQACWHLKAAHLQLSRTRDDARV